MPGLASLTTSLFNRIGERRAQCAILELDENDKPVGTEYIAFQYFPETITDTKQVNYQTKEIPGGSLPLYQWTSSGERIVSFQAYFTSDVDLLQDPQIFTKLKTKGYLRRNVDPRTAVTWLRRFMLPRYGEAAQLGVPLTQAPRKMILRIQNSGIGLAGGDVANTLSSTGGGTPLETGGLSMLRDSMFAIMTQCEITYQAFFPSGMPRILVVQLSFAQTAQLGGVVTFPAATDALDTMTFESTDDPKVFPYPLRVQFK